MTAPEDPNGLREALARWLREWADRPGTLADGNTLADALIAGPLASLITERDEKCERLWGLWMAARDRAFAAEAEITRLKDGMEALGAEAARFREDLAWIADQMPATCEMTVVHEMADRAHRALSPKEQPHG